MSMRNNTRKLKLEGHGRTNKRGHQPVHQAASLLKKRRFEAASSVHFDHSSHPPVLLVEDDDNDILFMQIAFKRAGMEHPLVAVHDGEMAIEYLSGTGRYNDRERFPLPCIIVTDLKMPRMDGFDLLEWMQGRPELAGTPAIVLSSSDQPADR